MTASIHLETGHVIHLLGLTSSLILQVGVFFSNIKSILFNASEVNILELEKVL